jgi:hypothetical protein
VNQQGEGLVVKCISVRKDAMQKKRCCVWRHCDLTFFALKVIHIGYSSLAKLIGQRKKAGKSFVWYF